MANLNMQKPLVSFAGNHLGDNTRTGNIFEWEAKETVLDGSTKTVVASGSPGVLTAPIGWMYFSPQLEPGLVSGPTASLVVQQTPGAGGNLPIRGIPSGTPNAGYRVALVNGVAMIQLDCCRSLVLAIMGTGGSPSSAFNFYASGADFWGQRLTVQKTVGAGLVATTVYDLLKSFKYLESAVVSGATGCPIWVGVGATFGLDYYTPSTAFLNRVTYNDIDKDINGAGVFVAPPALDATPTVTGNDVRGAIQLSTNGSGLTANKFLSVNYMIEGATAQSANTYTLDLNLWTPTPNQTRVLHTLGAPQYYNANLA
jgi:hypothetical protein